MKRTRHILELLVLKFHQAAPALEAGKVAVRGGFLFACLALQDAFSASAIARSLVLCFNPRT